ncbi:MAG: hypothetical protein KatS3mg131_2523 [Candidatus Tectimicrobiota bacterium]|nr:MAG: hypothetical protein KatS3mg131_2523 [Candidatus Tectomicrobia bacterium]
MLGPEPLPPGRDLTERGVSASQELPAHHQFHLAQVVLAGGATGEVLHQATQEVAEEAIRMGRGRHVDKPPLGVLLHPAPQSLQQMGFPRTGLAVKHQPPGLTLLPNLPDGLQTRLEGPSG